MENVNFDASLDEIFVENSLNFCYFARSIQNFIEDYSFDLLCSDNQFNVN